MKSFLISDPEQTGTDLRKRSNLSANALQNVPGSIGLLDFEHSESTLVSTFISLGDNNPNYISSHDPTD